VAENFEKPRQKSSVNEAGQDVSNIPELPPEEKKAGAECLRNYYESLLPE
jgi:hypothetical protein